MTSSQPYVHLYSIKTRYAHAAKRLAGGYTRRVRCDGEALGSASVCATLHAPPTGRHRRILAEVALFRHSVGVLTRHKNAHTQGVRLCLKIARRATTDTSGHSQLAPSSGTWGIRYTITKRLITGSRVRSRAERSQTSRTTAPCASSTLDALSDLSSIDVEAHGSPGKGGDVIAALWRQLL
jgi:hypothetical protein